jgi:hypothetical protein
MSKNMKNLLYLIILFTLTLQGQVYSQEAAQAVGVSKWFVGVNSGISNIFGKYTEKDYSNNTSGFATNTGFNIGLEGAYYFNKYIGIGGAFTYSQYKANKLENYVAGYASDFGVEALAEAKSSYRFTNIYVGPYFALPLNKVTLEGRFLVGTFSNMTTPRLDVLLQEHEHGAEEEEHDHGHDHAHIDKPSFSQLASNGIGFSFTTGVGARIPVYKGLSAVIRIDYFYGKPDIKIKNENRVNNNGRLVEKYNEAIMGINSSVGIAYEFGK